MLVPAPIGHPDEDAGHRDSARPLEEPVALFQKRHRRSKRNGVRQDDSLVVDCLEAVEQHRAVDLDQDVAPDLDRIVRPDTHDVGVEGSMVNLAEGQAVRHDGLPGRVTVREYVGGIQELGVVEVTDRARHPIGEENSLAEAVLVNALADSSERVAPTQLVAGVEKKISLQDTRLVGLDSEGAPCSVVSHHIYRPDRQVLARHQAIEVDQRDLALHRPAETHVVRMVRIRASVAVDEPILRPPVLVRRFFPLDPRDRQDAEGNLGQGGGLEDALRTDYRNPGPLEVEAGCKERPGQDLASMLTNLVSDPGERRCPD